MTLTEKDKGEIAELLNSYCERYGSRNAAAQSLRNVGASTVSSVLNGKWKNISDEMWRNIRAQVSDVSNASDWEIVETPTFTDVTFCFRNAQEEKSMTWLTAAAGSGKTTAAEYYRATNKNVIYLQCDEDMRKSSFAIELARAAGMRINTQKLAREKIMMVIDYISELEDPLLIFDEGDKLPDNVLTYFITMQNRLKSKCGIVFLSTSYMKRRMELGLRCNRKGYQEIESRIGRKFYDAEEPCANDVVAICMANGVTDKAVISKIVNDAEQCSFDLRRAEKKIRAERKKLRIKN